MSFSFNNVNSFRLKYPQYIPFRKNKPQHGEWIEIYKNKNELPTAKLKTWVLYHRDDGFPITGEPNNSHNYTFYGNFVSSDIFNFAEQEGWIFGFPLFKVGATPSNWPKFYTANTNILGVNHPIGSKMGNDTMLVDLSHNRNIITLDFEGYNVNAFSGLAKSLDYITNNIEENGFYLNLRIKNSSENELKNFRTHVGQVEFGWATLVEYEYECDIIGPKSMLDMNLDYFLYTENSQSTESKLFGESLIINNTKFKLSYIDYIESNSYHDNFKISILTGLGPEDSSSDNEKWGNNNRRMDTDQIYDNLIYSEQYINGSPIELQSVFSSTNNTRVTKIIGGFYNTSKTNGYYPNLTWYSNYYVPVHEMTNTSGWNRNSKYVSNSGNNGLNKSDTDIKIYELNNILWCSLNSQRKKKVRIYGNGGNINFRYIDNFLDLNGEYCNGGGYGRFKNTIDLPRNNIKPYYSNKKVNNSNTINLFNEFNNDENVEQYFHNNSIITMNDISNSKFCVYYKLLIPPISGEKFKISYNFGMNSNSTTVPAPSNIVGGVGSKVTFFRYSDMDGNTIPSSIGEGESNLWALRDNETIELEWTINDIDSNGDISMKKIILIDVASGKSVHSPLVEISPPDSSLTLTQNGSVENYEITANVVQFLNVITVGQNIDELKQNTYVEKNFNNVVTPQSFFVEITPKNYEPYRYYNKYIPFTLSSNFNSHFNDIDSPIVIKNEQINYNYRAIKPNYTTILNTDIKQDLSPIIENPINSVTLIDISENEVEDKRIEITRNTEELKTDDQIILFESQENLITNNENIIKLYSTLGESIDFVSPHTLNLTNKLIPDYWRLYKPIVANLYFNTNKPNNVIPYEYMSSLINKHNIKNTSVSFTDENVRNVKYILINSNENKNDLSALAENGLKTTDNLIIGIAGYEDFTVQLDEHPMIIRLSLSPSLTFNPFGSNREYNIGDINANPRSENGGVNLPTSTRPSEKFSMNIPLNNAFSRFNKYMKSGDDTNNLIWNNVYDVNIQCLDDGQNGNAGYQNSDLNGFDIAPNNFKVLLVNINKLEYINPINPNTGEIDYTYNLNENNSTFTLEWKGFDFLLDNTFNKTVQEGGTIGKKIEIIWNISRLNTSTNISTTIFSATAVSDLTYEINGNEIKYKFIDRNVRIYDKYIYSVKGICRWTGVLDILLEDGVITDLNENIEIPSFDIEGFITPEYFICKNNRFPYGRFNTTATNLKLYRPLLLRTVGQVDQFGRKLGGDCSIVTMNRPNVLSDGGTNNNIYINTADQMTKKETFKRLSTLRLKR